MPQSRTPEWANQTKNFGHAELKGLALFEPLQQLVRTLTRLTTIDLFIINADYLCVAGSGAYETAIGCPSPRDTAIGYSLNSTRATLVSDPGTNDACRKCSKRADCRDLANYTAPIVIEGETIAAVQAVAFAPEQHAVLEQKAADIAETITLFLIQSCKANPAIYSALGGGETESDASGLEKMIGESRSIRSLKDDIIRCAPLDSTILLQGESGTGKEVAAQAIHALSPRSSAPFVAVNCGAIPESIMESEFFGYASGTFTGARQGGKAGLFEHANGGTLFLDEIAELPLALQVKLLRVLQERTVVRLGERQERPVDVRIIAASNVDLAERAQTNRFRLDLYYRLSVIPLHVPPLREREGDIPLLIQHFIHLFCRRRGETPPMVDPALMQRFVEYVWPGNVRELKNFVEYGIALRTGDTLTSDTLADRFGSQVPSAAPHCLPFQAPTVKEQLRPVQSQKALKGEQELIDVLQRHGATLEGKKLAAKELGISLATLYRKIKRHHLTDAYRYGVS